MILLKQELGPISTVLNFQMSQLMRLRYLAPPPKKNVYVFQLSGWKKKVWSVGITFYFVKIFNSVGDVRIVKQWEE